MAKLIFSLQEAIEILKVNDNIPEQITDIEVKDDSISFKANVEIPIIKAIPFIKSVPIPISLKYADFENGNAIFKMTLALHEKIQKMIPMNKIANKLREIFSEKIPEEITVDYPKVFVDFNTVISSKVNGIKIEKFVYLDGEFVITTCSV